MTDDGARLRLAPHVRFRLDEQTGDWFLLYPERGLRLNATGTAVVRLLTGEHDLRAIVDRLVPEGREPARAEVEGAVVHFLDRLIERRLVERVR
jgi:coenzyme PQQ biosynthesis protein PqqD